MQKLSIETDKAFSFRSTVYSHGWCELDPFELDLKTWRFKYVFSDKRGKNLSPAVMYGEKGRVIVELENSKVDSDKVVSDARHILRLDDDLNEFYLSVAPQESLRWISEKNATVIAIGDRLGRLG